MNKQCGFTLIELMLFIIVSSILVSVLLLAYVNAVGQAPALLQNNIALQTARQCAEWYMVQRRVQGYSTITCSNPLSLPSFCTSPTGYNLTASCVPTTILSDTNYETITINVSGTGNATLTLLLAAY